MTKLGTGSMPTPWETSRDAVPPGHTQITIYTESTGKRVATVFDEEAAALIVKAPLLIKAREVLDRLLEENDTSWGILAETIATARALLAKIDAE
jgi:hypothetical protein